MLRVVRSETDADARPMASQAEFFMDYRNADGSVASMCGNGARVFGRYLVAAGLAEPGRIAFATRGGVRVAQVPEAGDVSVDMGPVIGDSGRVDVKVSNRFGSWQAVSAFVPNPHAVVTLDDLDVLGELEPPSIDAGGLYPDGANVEFVEVLADDHIRMRVHERGVGETLSCGTGACAAAWATWERQRGPEVRSTRVDVPGGTVTVSRDEHGHLHLAGPAVLVARGELMEQWWMGADGG